MLRPPTVLGPGGGNVGAGNNSGSGAGGCGVVLGISGSGAGNNGNTAMGVGGGAVVGNSLMVGGHVPDICPVCGLKLSTEEWNSHFLTELDRLYKLSTGMERANVQATYMFAPPCPAQENAIRNSHNRWEVI